MNFYYLCRKEDISQISGTGHVAEVAEFGDGTVAVRWPASRNATGVASTTIFNSVEDLLKVHGHQGRTVAEPVLDGTRVRMLEAELSRLRRRFLDAVALLDEHQIAVSEDLRREANHASRPTHSCSAH